MKKYPKSRIRKKWPHPTVDPPVVKNGPKGLFKQTVGSDVGADVTSDLASDPIFSF